MKVLSIVVILVGLLSMVSIVSGAKQCWIRVDKIDGTIDNIDAPDGGIIDPYIKVYGYNSGGSTIWRCDTDYDFNDVTPDWYDICYIGSYNYIKIKLMDYDPDSDDPDDYLGQTHPDIYTGNWKCDGNWYGAYSQDLSSRYGNLEVEYKYKCTC